MMWSHGKRPVGDLDGICVSHSPVSITVRRVVGFEAVDGADFVGRWLEPGENLLVYIGRGERRLIALVF